MIDFIFENYIIVVTIIALIYSIGIRKIQYSIGNQKEMQELQQESKRLNDEFKKATEEKNDSKMQALMQQQQQLMPKMGGLMVGQFKVMGVILVLFLGLTWTLNTLDPFIQDDITLPLMDDGLGCDAVANDLIYSGCYNLTNENYGPWVVLVNAYREDGSIFSTKTQTFVYGDGFPKGYDKNEGEPMNLTIEKELYNKGEEVLITAAPERRATKVEATLNNGTWFYIDLPFTIPILNINRIHHIVPWFITISITIGIIVMPIYKKIRGDKNAKTEKPIQISKEENERKEENTP